MMYIKEYKSEFKNLWDNFVRNSKNSHFFFYRDYMEYHEDRFTDFSLLFFDDKKNLIALLPANINDNVVYSHQGLTYGGILVNKKMTTSQMLDIFLLLKDFLRKKRIKKLIYKTIPYIYYDLPSEEDKYAIFINGGELIRRDINSVIYIKNSPSYYKGKKWIINKAKKENLVIEYSKDYKNFWQLLEEVLMRNHGVKPVHTLEEILKLQSFFPENIKLFVVKKEEKILAGAVIFENKRVVHTQYLANSEEGREIGALDFLIDRFINDIYKDKCYLSFGISTENEGKFLNRGLISWKEGFGARGVVHDFYELKIE